MPPRSPLSSSIPHAPYRPHRARLAGDRARLYDLLLDGILHHRDRTLLPRGTTGSQIQDLLELIRQENPLALFEEAQVIHSGFGLNWGNPMLALTYRPDVAELQAKTAQTAREVLHRCGNATAGTAARALRFHDHLASRCRYAPDAPLAHDAPGALVRGEAVCDGIARAYKLLCDEAGIPCAVVTGSSGGPHAWNIAWVEGHWAHVDVTDDLASPGGHGPVSRAFFGLSDREVLRERTIDSEHPPCPNNLGFYRSLGLYAKTPAQLAGLCHRQFVRGERDFEVELGEGPASTLSNDELLNTVGSALLRAGRSGRVQLSARRTGVVRVVV